MCIRHVFLYVAELYTRARKHVLGCGVVVGRAGVRGDCKNIMFNILVIERASAFNMWGGRRIVLKHIIHDCIHIVYIVLCAWCTG